MKSEPRPSKSRSFQLLKSTSNHSGKIRRTNSMTLELPESLSRKISSDQVPRKRSPGLSENFEISMESALESSGTKRKILADSPVSVKRFKDSQGKSVQDLQADCDSRLKGPNAKENETVAGVELHLRSDDRPVILIPAPHTWNKKKEVKVMDPAVKSSAENFQEIVINDASMETYQDDEESDEDDDEESDEDDDEESDEDEDEESDEDDGTDDETDHFDEETASDDVETEEEDDSIGNGQDSTCQVVGAEGDDIENHQDVNLESNCDLESSIAIHADALSLEESEADANVVEIDQANLEPEFQVDGKSKEAFDAKSNEELDAKSNEEFDTESHKLGILSFNEECTISLSISNLTSSSNFEESVAGSITSDGLDMETVAKDPNLDTEESYIDETNAVGISSQVEGKEMEQDDDGNSADSTGGSKGTKNVDLSSQSMTSGGQIIRDVGVNQTSPDDSNLAGPSTRIENFPASSFMMPQDSERIHQCQRVTKIERVVAAADGKEAVLTHESVRNYTLLLSSGDDAPNLSSPDGNMVDSLFLDEGDEELERIMVAWNKTQLRMQQCESGQNGCSLMEGDSDLNTNLAMILVFFILFITKHLIEAMRSVPPF